MSTSRVITVSDRSYRGERPDAGGPLVKELLTAAGYEVDGIVVVPDEDAQIRQALMQGAAEDVALIVTTGGTGFSPRDITPEATAELIERMTPGLPELMRSESCKYRPI